MLHADFTIVDRHGAPVAMVVVKSRRETSRAWAIGLWNNLFAHANAFLPAPYFLVATLDRLFLWRNAGERQAPEPDVELDLRPVLRQYFEKAEPGTISGMAFELLVEAWLSDLTRLEDTSSGPRALEESGLLASIQNGRIAHSVAA